MANLIAQNIVEIFDAKIDQGQLLQFHVRINGENGTSWVSENLFARQTLNSRKFKTFYYTDNASIH